MVPPAASRHTTPTAAATTSPPHEDDQPRYRTGAVARLLDMPVATLRIWERRYAVSGAARTASGHRLYSARDVRRLALLRHLSQRGHAIGLLATLEVVALEELAAPLDGPPVENPAARPWRVLVVGEGFASRLQRPAIVRRIGRPVQVVASRASLEDAAGGPGIRALPEVDQVLVHLPGLAPELPGRLREAVRGWGSPPVGVVFGFAAAGDVRALAGAGIAHCRDGDGELLVQWLRGLAQPPAGVPTPSIATRDGLPEGASPPPRRFDDQTLADVAEASTTIACECPRHVCELLLALGHFEAYSAACVARSPADAHLHRDLQAVAGRSRALFEGALAAVAAHEGLSLEPRAGRPA